jgi:hypothetical protein
MIRNLLLLLLGVWASSPSLCAQVEKLYVGNGYFFGRTGTIHALTPENGGTEQLYSVAPGDTLMSILEDEQFHLWTVKSVKRITGRRENHCVEGPLFKIDVKLLKTIKKPDILIPTWRAFCSRFGHSYATFRYHDYFETILSNDPGKVVPTTSLPYENSTTEAIDFSTMLGSSNSGPIPVTYSVEVKDTWTIGYRKFMLLHCQSETMNLLRLVELRNDKVALIVSLPVF